MLLTDETNLPEYVFTEKKFLRREDLTESIRSYIAVKGFLAKQSSQRGGITNISRQFNISRPFVYEAISSLEAVLPIIFSKIPSKINSVDKKNVRLVVLASDEIFSQDTPILVTVDPVSSAILRIELSDTRKADNWIKH